MNRRALVLSLFLASVSVSLMVLYVRRFEQEMSGGQRIRVLVALKPLKRGMLVTDDVLTFRDIPIAYVEQRAIKANEKVKIEGVHVANPVQAQAVLMWSDLAVGNDERDLSSLIQPGKRALTVRASNADKGNALTRPGDYVDVLVTTADPQGGDNSGSEKSVVLLQRVLVLAVGLSTEPVVLTGMSRRPNTTDLVLTLSLNLQEAQLLELASNRGTLSVVLRNPEDQRVVEGIPDMQVKSLFDSQTREKIQGVQRAAVAAVDQGPIKLERENR